MISILSRLQVVCSYCFVIIFQREISFCAENLSIAEGDSSKCYSNSVIYERKKSVQGGIKFCSIIS